jgi:5-methylcytosine-specific restriction enzyme subunit McrC
VIDVGPLTQYGTTRVRLTEAQARRLDAGAGNALTISTDPEPGWWSVTASEMVGSLVVGDLRVLIRPKIPPENLFLLLEVGLPEAAWRREAFDYATDTDLLPAIVSFFARTVETTLARGVLRAYRAHEERVQVLRGRVDIAEVIRHPGPVSPVPCRFDEFSADITENRYLRAAVRRSMLVPIVPAEDRRRLLRQLVALEEVEDVSIRPDDLDRIHITRLNQHYVPALRLARLLLESLTLTDQVGSTRASSFLVDMNKLFERFVTARLRRALRGRLEVRAEPTVHLDTRNRVGMSPDLEFRRAGRPVFVGDLKYKLTGNARARTPDYYQLLAYTTALDLPEGVLIYCLADEGKPSGTVTVRHAGKQLHLHAIDLTGSAADIDDEIKALADWVDRSAVRM